MKFSEIFSTWLLAFGGIKEDDASHNILPKPQDIKVSGPPLIFDINLPVAFEQEDDLGILKYNFESFISTLNSTKWGPDDTFEETPDLTTASTIEKIQVKVKDTSTPLQYKVDESYHLTIANSITIEAETIWGGLNALKTLQQLVSYANNTFFIDQNYQIFDEPFLSHRGLLIDSSRNFLSLEALKENIDLMALSKMNVLHWHLQDTQSWPIQLETYPQMTKDAYSESEIYTQQDIKALIEYAMFKGIRIIPELDLPGHSNAGYKQIDPDILICNEVSEWSKVAVEPPSGQLDVTAPKVYSILENIFKELSSLFPDKFFHIGHDEVNKHCYQTSEKIQTWFKKNPGTEFKDLFQHWLDASLPLFSNSSLIMWEDILNENITIPKNITIQNWLGAENIKKITSQNYDVIVSTSDYYYLDCGFGSWVTNYVSKKGSWCDPYKDWQNIYSFDYLQNLTEQETHHVVGAEVALWSELVDSNNLVTKVWPRAAAFAESAWSGNKKNLKEFTPRMFRYREYLVKKGHRLDPLAPKYCWKYPGSCDL